MQNAETPANVRKNAGLSHAKMPRAEDRREEGGSRVPRRRDRMPPKRGPFPRRHYGVLWSRDDSRGSAVAKTLAGEARDFTMDRPDTIHETPDRDA